MNQDAENYRERLNLLNKLVRAVCHHAKGVITTLEGGLYLVNSGIEKNNPERIRQGGQMLDRSARRFAHLISRILYWGAERDFSPVEINLIEIAQEVVNSLKDSFNHANVVLNCDFSEVGVITAEPSAISALIADLLDAHVEMCKASGKEECLVNFEIKRDAEKISFVVSDNCGFLSEEDIPTMMNPSFASQGKEILELNYYIINRIAKLHGGTFSMQISADSKVLSIVTIPLNI